MNCKKDDLAIVVSATQNPMYIGCIVRCIAEFKAERGAAWVVDPPLGDWGGVYDYALRPIGNPGEHEVDEMVKLADRPVGVAA